MNRLSLRIGLWLCSFFILITTVEITACGPMLYTDEARFSLFRKETMGDVSFDPFHYSHNYYSGFTASSFQTERKQNIEEWVNYGDKKFSRKSTELLQYHTTPDSFLKAYNSKDFSSFDGNDFMEFLLEQKNEDALEYFAFAKQVESAQQDDEERMLSWQYFEKDESKFQPAAFKTLLATAAQKLKEKRLPKFLKERYAFQYLKCAYYDYLYNNNNKLSPAATKIYEKYLASSTSVVAQWSLIYFAALQSNKTEKIKYLLQAFDKSADKRFRAFTLLKAETNDLNIFYHAFKESYYQNLIDIIGAIKNTGPALEQIKWLYQTDKNSPYLQLLMTREINKLEDWIWSNPMLKFYPALRLNQWEENHWNNFLSKKDFASASPWVDTSYAFYASDNLKKDVKYLQEVISFYQSMNFGDDIKKNNFKDIALIHLFNLSGDYAQAENMMKALNKNQTNEALVQINIERIILIPQVFDVKLQKTKDLIAMAMFDIEQNLPKSDLEKWYGTQKEYYLASEDESIENKSPGNIDPQIFVYLGRTYLDKGERLIGAMFLQKSGIQNNEYAYSYSDEDSNAYAGLSYLDQYCTPEDMDLLLALKKKQYPNKFESYTFPSKWSSDYAYIDLKGTLQLRAGDYKSAVATFSQLPENYWEENPAFKEYLSQYKLSYVKPLKEDEWNKKEAYPIKSKKLIAQDLFQLQQDTAVAKGSAAKAQAYLKYANALFNISYYGKAWMAYAYGKSVTEVDARWQQKDNYAWTCYYIQPSLQNNTKNYYELENAMAAYQTVMKYAPQSELGAQAAMMLNYCDVATQEYKNSIQNPYFYSYNWKARKSKYLDELKSVYGQTKTYQLNATKCPDIR